MENRESLPWQGARSIEGVSGSVLNSALGGVLPPIELEVLRIVSLRLNDGVEKLSLAAASNVFIVGEEGCVTIDDNCVAFPFLKFLLFLQLL